MVELLDYDFTPFPKIVRWVAEMRKIKEINQADEKFMANREALKALRPKPEAKL